MQLLTQSPSPPSSFRQLDPQAVSIAVVGPNAHLSPAERGEGKTAEKFRVIEGDELATNYLNKMEKRK